MKKVLILAYDFPPYVSVGGLRPYSWYNYFKEFGLYPIVVTRQWGNKYGNHLDYIAPSESNKSIREESEMGIIIRTPYKPNLANRILLKFGENKFVFIRRIISVYFEFMQFIFNIGPKSGLYYGARDYIKANQVDLIIATGEPFVLFKYASKLARKNNIPWVADYRDPWSHSSERSKNTLIKTFYTYMEKKTLKSVSLVITVSDFLISLIELPIKFLQYKVVSNGYDEENARKASQISQTTKGLNIAFTGSLYKWHPIKLFLEEIENIMQQNEDFAIHINFYGINEENFLRSLLTTLPKLQTVCNIYPKTPNVILLENLAKNNVLLLFNDYSILGTKIFDYLAVRRHIILCFSEDEEALNLKKQYFQFFFIT